MKEINVQTVDAQIERIEHLQRLFPLCESEIFVLACLHRLFDLLTAEPSDWQQRAEAAEAALKVANEHAGKFEREMYLMMDKAEAAEAKLAELAKQEPIGAFHIRDQDIEATSDYVDPGQWPVDNGVIEVFTRAAPAADLAELVPDVFQRDADFDDDSLFDIGVKNGWNACRAAILHKIEEQTK